MKGSQATYDAIAQALLDRTVMMQALGMSIVLLSRERIKITK